jgi:hypothetical protein
VLGWNLILPKHPGPLDFEIQISEAYIQVIFVPTRSHYIFRRFFDHKVGIEIERAPL